MPRPTGSYRQVAEILDRPLAEGRRRADNLCGMSLLAYSVRRAFGALLVFLVVIWLLLFGIAHLIGASSNDALALARKWT